MPSSTALLRRTLVFIHRWLGVALSVLFLLWFASGIVMMYWSYPEVTAEDRLGRAPVLDPARIRLSPEEAVAALTAASGGGPVGFDQPAAPIRLASFDGRPVYRLGRGGAPRRGSGPTMVYADDGSVHQAADSRMIDRAAAAWAGLPVGDATKETVDEVDQWTVGALRGVRPLFKFSWPDGQQVYVDGNAEVVQYTTRASRFWAYLGAIPHWLYFTPLRKHQSQWYSFVVWSSLIGTMAALLGIVIVLWMYSPRKRYRHDGMPTSIPYRGWKRWHAVAGLAFGIVTTTWAFSGLLSMGPFPIMERLAELTVPPAPAGQGDASGRGRGPGAARGVDLTNALRGSVSVDLARFDTTPPAAAVAALGDFEVKELELTSFAGAPVYLASNGRRETRIIPVGGEPKAAFDVDEVMRIVREAAGDRVAELRLMAQYDAYYLDRRRERPLPVIYARMNDPAGTRYYIDPRTGRVVGSYSARNWVDRWLYRGLHSLDFPWLYNYRPLWDIVVLTLMLGGTALCVTSIVLTWRVLARKLAAALRARVRQPDEDLATG